MGLIEHSLKVDKVLREESEGKDMEVTAITRARALVMMELDALANGGKIRLSDCILPLVERYDFQKFPAKPEDFDLQNNGVKFEGGKARGLVIDSLTLYDGAMVLDTLSSTSDSKAVLLDLLEWGRAELGLSYDEKLIRRWGYISHVVFKSEFPLLELMSSPIQKLAAKVTAVTEETFQGLKYVPSQIWIGHDPALRKHSIASFTIVHRVNTSFSDNEFFSEAPLPTDLHLEFLSQFEKDIEKTLR